MKRTEKGFNVIIKAIDENDNVKTFNFISSATNENGAIKDAKKHAFIENGFTPYKFNVSECDGKTYDVEDIIYFHYASTENKPDRFYKTFTVDSAIIDYVVVDVDGNDEVKHIEMILPVGTSANDVHKIAFGNNEFIYRIRYQNKPTELKLYMNMTMFKMLAK